MSHYLQGDLDNCCGIYSLINAIDILTGTLNHYEARILFKQILICINSRDNKLAIGEGLTLHEVARVINQVLCKEFPIRRYKPFYGLGAIKLNDYWSTLQAELNQPHSLAFIGIGGCFNHWTLVKKITDKNLILQDSINIRYLNKRHCIMGSHRAKKLKRYWLYPNKTYILKLK